MFQRNRPRLMTKAKDTTHTLAVATAAGGVVVSLVHGKRAEIGNKETKERQELCATIY